MYEVDGTRVGTPVGFEMLTMKLCSQKTGFLTFAAASAAVKAAPLKTKPTVSTKMPATATKAKAYT